MNNNNNCQNLHAAAYIRVSTEDQAEYSPSAQLRAIIKYCEGRNIMLSDCHIYQDQGVSGRKAERRPGFMAMIAEAKKKPRPFEYIIVHKFDRFARNREDSVVYKSMLRKECGIRVISVTEQMEDDKFSIILESMLEAMAEYYSINLGDEVKKGMMEKALRGELQTPAPLGYVYNNGQLIHNKKEASIIKLIFQLYNEGGMEPGSIAAYLNEAGCMTKKGNLFKKRSVLYILKNPVYAGFLRWNNLGRQERENGKSNPIIVKGNHSPIIAQKDWLAALDKLALTDRKIKIGSKHYLQGVLKCGICLGNMYLNGGKKNIFRCGNYLNGKGCYSQGVSINHIEKIIETSILNDEQRPEAISLFPLDLPNIGNYVYGIYYIKESNTVRIEYKQSSFLPRVFK